MVEVQPLDEAYDAQSAEQADDRTQAHVEQEAGDQVGDQHLGFWIGVGGDDLDQRDGEEDRDQVIGAGLDLQRGADALAQIDLTGAQQEENRRCVGRGDRCAEQKFQPRQVEGR